MNFFKQSALLFFMLLGVCSAEAEPVFIEAEGFDDLGGWVLDQQFMDFMGSPFLLAHGMGVPVQDAITSVDFPAPGTYRLWVRTRNWAAPWSKEAPGKFQILLDGKVLPTLFGNEGDPWHWQDGGFVAVRKRSIKVAIHDLTGFEGRCDALIFSADGDFVPPNEAEAMARFRRKALGLPERPEDARPLNGAAKFDLVVIGGGIAGTCAAVSAARLGLQVALIQDRPILGGNNSSDVRVHLGGKINLPPYPELGDVVQELAPEKQGNAGPASRYEDDKKLAVVRAEKNISLFLNMHANEIEQDDQALTAVLAQNVETGRRLRFAAPLFADCTGDGTIGCLAGADYRMGREGRDETGESLAPEKADAMTMGASVQWYSKNTGAPSDFPDCPWALQFNEESSQKVTGGEWNWETGMNRDQISEFETVRDHALRAVYGNWSFMKNQSSRKAKYKNLELDWVAYVAGKRESRRLMGDVVLKEQDIMGRRIFPDAFVTSTWTIDLHYPEPRNTKYFPGEEFRSVAKHQKIAPYPVPYRCFYSRNVGNLFMAGRDISVTHVALGTIRVMRTTGMMGEVVGMAASLCRKHETNPRGVYKKHLEELKELAKKGVGK